MNELSRTFGSDRGQAKIFDGKTDGQDLTPNSWRCFTVTSKWVLTVDFERIRKHSCGFAGDSRILGEGVTYANAGIVLATMMSLLVFHERTQWRQRALAAGVVRAALACIGVGRAL